MMKYYLLIFSIFSFSSYADIDINPDTHPVIYEGEMLLAEMDSDGFYRAKFFGAEYICFNCTDDFGQHRPKGIWHRNLESDNTDIFNPKVNPCSSYKLDWRIHGFYVDNYKRSGLTHSSEYNGVYGSCSYSVSDKAISKIEDVERTTTIKKITLSENFQPYLIGSETSYLPDSFVSEKAKNASLSIPTYKHRMGTETYKEMKQSVPTDVNYATIVFYPVGMKNSISPYELYAVDFAKYYTCTKSSTSYFLNTTDNLDNICQLNPALKIVNNKIYLNDENVNPDTDDGGSGGGDTGGGGGGDTGSGGGDTGGGSGSGGGGSGGGGSGGGGSGGGDSGGGDSGGDGSGGGGSGGGSGSGGDGSGGGNTDGDGDLLAEVKSFHRSFKNSLDIDEALPGFDESHLDYSDVTNDTERTIDKIQSGFTSSVPSFKSSLESLNDYIPDMSIRIDDINNSFSAITGICRPLSFDVTMGMVNNTSINKTIVLTDFCIWYDNNIRGFVTWVFRFMTAVSVYFIVVRGLQGIK